jgi:hypothetical protein
MKKIELFAGNSRGKFVGFYRREMMAKTKNQTGETISRKDFFL